MYTEIKNQIMTYLSTVFSSSQLINQDQHINGDQTIYCRYVTTYGQLNDYLNNANTQSILISLQIYEKKQIQINTYEDTALQIRNYLNKNLKLIKDTNGIAKLDGISLSKNSSTTNWNAININITYIINKEN